MNPGGEITLTIGISTWNRAKELENLLESLNDDIFHYGTFEIIVADSDSKDGTLNIINRYSALLNIKHFNVENTPVLKRNVIIKYSIGNVVILLDDDVVVQRGFIDAHYEASTKNIDSFFCGQVRFREELIKSSNYYRFRDGQHLSNIKDLSEVSFNKIVTMNISSLKSNFLKVGFFNEAYIGYGCEDLDYGFRIIQKGFKLRYLSGAFVYHDEKSNNISGYGKKLYLTGLYGSRIFKEQCIDGWNKIYKRKLLLKFIFLHLFNREKLEQKLLIDDTNTKKYSYLLFKIYLYIRFFEGINDQKKNGPLSLSSKEKEW